MELLGNEELLNHPLVAFFASRNAPPEAWKRAREWAQSISRSDRVVISGFHSPIERAVCDVLLENNSPIVVTLGRALYKKIPSHLLPAQRASYRHCSISCTTEQFQHIFCNTEKCV